MGVHVGAPYGSCHPGDSPSSKAQEPTGKYAATAKDITSWKMFVEGDALYDAMTNDIAEASSSIRMESYIFAADAVGRQIAAALAIQARRGRRVELRVDYAGSRWELSGALVRELCGAGVLFEWSRRWQWLRPWEFHRRNHRKLLIIDDTIAYTGGFNVHVTSSLRLAGQSRWRDTHVRFDGPAVGQAIDVFEGSGREVQEPWQTSNPFRLMPNATRHCRWRLRCEFDRVLRAAERRVWLTTPYFLPDRRLRGRLVRAARRGVDVRVLMPAKNDVPISQWASRALYRGMLRNGIRLYEYQPRVLHAKTLLVDDAWATIGTANFDYRSLFVNAEVNLIASDERFCEALARQFRTDIEASHEIRAEHWQRRSWWKGIPEKLAWSLRRWL